MQISIRKSDVSLWGWWVVAAVLGRGVYYVIENNLELPVLIATGLVSGITRAVPQWAVLWDRLRRADLWGVATLLGVTANAVVIFYTQDQIQQAYLTLGRGSLVSFYIFFPLLHAAQAALIGFFQWLVLRREVFRAGHWIWGAALGGAISTVVNLRLLTWALDGSASGSMPGWIDPTLALVTTAVRTAITGLVLVWLLHKPKEAMEAEVEMEDAMEEDKMEEGSIRIDR